MKTSRRLPFSCALLGALGSLTSCGGTNLGANLAISVSPSSGAYIVPGQTSSCQDRAAAAASGTVLAESIQGPLLFFSDFKIQWKGTDPFTISLIRVTISGSGLPQDFQYVLDPDEIEALIGKASGVISTNTAIDSNVASEKDSAYPACGLAIGGITIPTTQKQAFNARVEVEVIGTSAASDGTLTPVKQTVYASADYLGDD